MSAIAITDDLFFNRAGLDRDQVGADRGRRPQGRR
jgi:hypothetical protein